MNEVNNNINVPEQNTVNVQEPVNMVNNVNNQPPKKSKKGIIVIILLLLIIAGLCTFIYLKKDVLFNSGNNTNENNSVNNDNKANDNNQTQTDNKPKELSNEDKKRILDIIGLTENGYPRMDNETIQSLNLNGADYIDYNAFDVAPYLINLVAGNHTINDLDAESFNYFLFNVCKNIITIKTSEDSNLQCTDDAGACYGITENEYKEISKKYNINESKTATLQKYNGNYIIRGFSSLLNPAKITDSLAFSYDNDDVLVTYNIYKTSINNDEINNPTINKKIVYRFKTLDDGSYYLNDFTITNN